MRLAGWIEKMRGRVNIAHRGVNFTRREGFKLQIHWKIALALAILE